MDFSIPSGKPFICEFERGLGMETMRGVEGRREESYLNTTPIYDILKNK